MASRTPAPPHRRVRRGSAEDHDELRQHIVAAAFAIHARDGVAALSMRTLAAELGVSAMALYRYYPRRADLLPRMGEVVLPEAQEPFRAARAKGPPPRERLRPSFAGFFAYWEAHPSMPARRRSRAVV